jgi:hypothetical protein
MIAPLALEPAGQAGPESRNSPRSNMFLGATLQGEGSCAPVKVRNMSVSGALVEGDAIPRSGAAVRLVRGGLSVPAFVIWSAHGRCGLEFTASITVGDWLAPPKNMEQQRVDDMVRLVKQGAAPAVSAQPPPARAAQLGDELARVRTLLERTGDSLSSDEALVERHGSELQSLDICSQTIEAVADALRGDCRQSAERLASLRLSMEQALRWDSTSP